MAYAYTRLDATGVPLLKQLLRVFGEAFGEQGTCQGRVPGDAYQEALLGKSDFIVLVAQEGNEVVGGLAAYVLEKFEQERKEIFIYDLAVSRDHRRRGIATGLIQNLQRAGKELGACVIFVQADKTDIPAIRLYESLGIREDVFSFDIKIS